MNNSGRFGATLKSNAGALWVIGLLAVGLRCVGLVAWSLWFDEAMSWRTVSLGWPQMIDSIIANTHAPFFFCLLKLWVVAWGDSLLALRSLNVVIALASVLVAYIWLSASSGSRRFSEPPLTLSLSPATPVERGHTASVSFLAISGALLLATSPFQIRIAGEARMYPLLVLLTLISSWCLLRSLDRRTDWRPWIAAGVSCLLMLYTHYFALFLVAAQWSYAAYVLLANHGKQAGIDRSGDGNDRHCSAEVTSRWTGIGGFLTALAVIAIGWSFWFPVFWKQRGRVAADWWTEPFQFSDVLNVTTKWLFAVELANSGQGVLLLSLAVVLGVLVAAFVWGRRLGRFAVWMTVVPTGLAVASSLIGTNVMIARYFAGAQAMFLIALASVLSQLPIARLRRGLLGGVVALFCMAHGADLIRSGLFKYPGIEAAVASMESARAPGEPMFATSSLVYFPASFYARQRDALRLIDGPAGLPFYLGGPVIRREDRITREELERLTGDRVWVLAGRTPQSYPLPGKWKIEHQETFRGAVRFQEMLRVISYVRKSKAVQ